MPDPTTEEEAARLTAARAKVSELRKQPRTAAELEAEKDNAADYLAAVKELHARRLASGERVRAGARQALTAGSAFYAFVQSIAVGVLRFAIDSKKDHCTLFDLAVCSAIVGGGALALLALITLGKVDRLGTGGQLSLLHLQAAEYGVDLQDPDGERKYPAGPLHPAEARRRLAEAFEAPADALSAAALSRNYWADIARPVTIAVVLAAVVELCSTLLLLTTLRS